MEDEKKRVFNLTEQMKAQEIGMSVSFLQKDRMKAEPQFEFRKYGASVRYASES